MVDKTDARYSVISTIDELSSVDGFISADLAPVGTCFSEPLNSSSVPGSCMFDCVMTPSWRKCYDS